MPSRSWVLALILAGGCSIELHPKSSAESAANVDAEADSSAPTEDTTPSEDDGPPPVALCDGPSPCLTLGVCAAAVPNCDDVTGWDCAGAQKAVGWEEGGETSCDGKDNDCNGATDENILVASSPDCSPTGVCGAGAPSRCIGGAMVCQFDEVDGWQAVETSCDALDNDCNGQTDEMVGPAPDCLKEGVCAFSTAKCEGGQFKCSYPSDYEKTDEKTCDDLDNDCDGEIDEDLVYAGGATCPTKGVCAALDKPTCASGKWVCPEITIAGYEANETSCDGLDNDCDGDTDEGTSVPVEACPDAAKALLGVCKGATAAACVLGKAACDFAQAPGYEPLEASCDGKDNDCDGETDEGVTAAPPGTCKSVGECAFGVTAACENGLWTCKYGNPNYEAGAETKCDGKDNDCDGSIDEDTLGDPALCAKGICSSGGAKANCAAGKTVCDFSGVPGYEPIETSCDGKDNDCDGGVDVDLSFDLANTNACKNKGVCGDASKTFATCKDGAWTCDYASIPDFEAEPETLCDGRDNDCDGHVDEDIVVTDAPGCKSAGVCAGKLQALCIGDQKYTCAYADLVGFENPEVSCDNQDNDCDGIVDEGVCPAGYPCDVGEQCKSGICRPSPDPELSYCVNDVNHCPSADGEEMFAVDQKGCVALADGEGGEVWYDSTCKEAGWVKGAEPCPGNACVAGNCADCVPNTFNCASDGKSFAPCSAGGTIGSTEPCDATPQQTTCEVGGRGICLLHTEIQLDSGAVSSEPAIGFSAVNGLLVASWHQPQSAPFVGFGGKSRRINTSGVPAFSSPGVAQLLPSPGSTKDQRHVDVAPIDDKTMVVVWQEVVPPGTPTADEGNVKFRVQNYTNGAFPSSVQQVNLSTLTLEQSWPRITSRAATPGFAIAWQALSESGGNGFDIYVKSYGKVDPVGLPSAEKRVNKEINGQQIRPVVEELADQKLVVGYEDQSGDIGTSGVYAALFTFDLDPSGAPFLVNQTSAGDQTDIAIAPRKAGGFVAVWTSNHAGNKDIYARLFDAKGVAVGGEVLVTRKADGTSKPADQAHADVAAFANGSFIVVFEDAADDGNGTAVLYRQLDASLTPIDKDIRVNDVTTQGDQRHPRLAAAGTADKPWFEVVFESVEGAASSIYGRAFELK